MHQLGVLLGGGRLSILEDISPTQCVTEFFFCLGCLVTEFCQILLVHSESLDFMCDIIEEQTKVYLDQIYISTSSSFSPLTKHLNINECSVWQQQQPVSIFADTSSS